MTLEKYRTHMKLTLDQLAELLGIEGPSRARTVHRYIRCERIPSRATLRQIEKATKGKVKSDDFPDEPVRVSRAAA